MILFEVVSEFEGERFWRRYSADDRDHAREQHQNAFPGERFIVAYPL